MVTDYHCVSLPAEFVDPNANVDPVTAIAFTEGPAVASDGTVYFSDLANNRIMQFDPQSGMHSVWREPSGYANGLLFDRNGRLLTCEGIGLSSDGRWHGGRRITQTNMTTGSVEVLTERYEGARFNAPNDIAACSNGRIFFTDPCYADRTTMEMEHESVYRIDPNGTVLRMISQPDIERPNGIALAPDEQTIYVVDSCPVFGGNRKIWAFDLADDGSLSNQRVVFDFAPGRGADGMTIDQQGNLYIAAGISRSRGPHESNDVPPGIWIVKPSGELQGRVPIPEDVVTNVTFGGEDLRTLYITAGKTLFTIRGKVPGFVVHRNINL